MTPPDTHLPEDIPDDVITALEDSSDQQLREIIEYAQRLLKDHPSLTDEIESRESEELVRMEDHGEYTIVIVERPEETGAARGPFAYRVKWETNRDDEASKYKWHYLGKVYGESVDE